MDPAPDPEGPKTRESGGSGFGSDPDPQHCFLRKKISTTQRVMSTLSFAWAGSSRIVLPGLEDLPGKHAALPLKVRGMIND
jgi:hypothetical protein